MTSEAPPVFQEGPNCDVCNRSFTAFRRRHHCRCCGRTLCNEHSSNQMALPQYGIHSNVRVCDDCYDNPSRSAEDIQGHSNTAAVVDGISRLHVNWSGSPEAKSISNNPVSSAVECKCGMPLCICEPPTPDPASFPVLHYMQSSTAASNQSNQRSKKPQQTAESISRKPSSSSNKKPSSFLNTSLAGSENLDKPKADYDVSGEGIREAIKNSDLPAVRKLLSEGVDANYCDRQGLSLLHLAAVFNQTEIAFILMDHGASVERKNAQGETPLDCAPTMLQYKMRQKIKDGMADPNAILTS